MGEICYLKKRGKKYSVRIVVSKKLHPYTTKREIERAIKTDSHRLARRIAIQVSDEYKLFEVDLIYLVTAPNQKATEANSKKVEEAFSLKLIEIERLIALEALGASHQSSLSNLYDQRTRPFKSLPPPAAAESSQGQGIMLSVATSDYLKDKAVTVTDKTIKRYKLICEVLLALVGDKPVTEVTREDLRSLRQSLPNIPIHREKQAEYQSMSLKEIVALPHDENREYYSENTQRSRLIDLTSLFTWLKREGYIQMNPAEGISNGYTRICTEVRSPFSSDELKRLFDSKSYLKATKGSMPHFWIPLIALYTGARLEEIAQLHTADIREEEGIWCIWLDTKSRSNSSGKRAKKDKKKVKTTSSRRVIPVHPALIQLGFVAYVKLVQEKGAIRLFPMLSNENANHAYGDVIGKWFRRYRIKEGKAPRRDTPFHSFRNTVSDRLKKSGIEDVMIKEILGHKHKDITNRYYAKEYSITQKQEAVLLLNYEAILNLDELIKTNQKVKNPSAFRNLDNEVF